MRVVKILLFLVGVTPLLPGLSAQAPENPDPFQSVLFTAEEIMTHRRAIHLTDEQRDAITRLIEDLQGRVVSLQWRLLEHTQEVKNALEGPRVDLDLVMDRFQEALDTEMAVKKAHLELLIRIKNVLTPEQQEELRKLRTGASSDLSPEPGVMEWRQWDDESKGVEP